MKRIILTALVILAVSLSTFSQNLDKIVKIKGDTLKVTIQGVNETSITFNYPNESIAQTINKKNILQVIYSSGRVENITTPIIIKGKEDWEKVTLTTNPNDVEGLTNLGEVEGLGKTKYGGEKQMRPKAEEAIKIQAAQKKAFIVFVKSQNISEVMTGSRFLITGIAYGY